MPKYKVTIYQDAYDYRAITLDAENPEAAMNEARSLPGGDERFDYGTMTFDAWKGEVEDERGNLVLEDEGKH